MFSLLIYYYYDYYDYYYYYDYYDYFLFTYFFFNFSICQVLRVLLILSIYGMELSEEQFQSKRYPKIRIWNYDRATQSTGVLYDIILFNVICQKVLLGKVYIVSLKCLSSMQDYLGSGK